MIHLPSFNKTLQFKKTLKFDLHFKKFEAILDTFILVRRNRYRQQACCSSLDFGEFWLKSTCTVQYEQNVVKTIVPNFYAQRFGFSTEILKFSWIFLLARNDLWSFVGEKSGSAACPHLLVSPHL